MILSFVNRHTGAILALETPTFEIGNDLLNAMVRYPENWQPVKE